MFETVTLPNGVRIVMEPMPFVRSVTFGIWVANGSRHENMDNNGISHFIEHMLFKGTEKRSAKDIAEELDAVGGQLNAFTTKEYTCYYARVLDTHFGLALDVLSDMFFNSKFDDAEIRKEANVILEEISMYEDTPEELVHDLTQYQVFRKDSLGYPILGTAETITKFTNSTFKNYCRDNYCPNNTIISVAGNIEPAHIVKQVEKYFSLFEKSECLTRSFSAQYEPSITMREKDIEQMHVCLTFPGIPSGNGELYPLAIMNAILGGGMSSRLFQSLREERGIVYSVYSCGTSYSDTGIFSVYAALNPSNGREAVRLMMEGINSIKADRITEICLRNTKEQLKSGLLLGLESSSSRMHVIGKSMVTLNRVIEVDEQIRKVDAVTLDDIDKVFDQVFDFSKMSITAIGKIEKSKINFEEFVKYGKTV